MQHLTDGERYWFGYHVAGKGRDDFDFSMEVPAERSTTVVLQAYRDAITASDAILAKITNLEELAAIAIPEKRPTVRWVLAHMTGETTRHAGHADFLRELIDGITGR